MPTAKGSADLKSLPDKDNVTPDTSFAGSKAGKADTQTACPRDHILPESATTNHLLIKPVRTCG